MSSAFTKPKIAQAVLLIAILSIVAARLFAVLDSRDPERDMAMLMTNVPLASWTDYFRPLPFYEQATTLGHLFIIDHVSQWFGTVGKARFDVIRAIAASVGLVGLGCMALALRGIARPLEIALILVLSSSATLVQIFSTSEKPYVFGLGAAGILLLLGRRYLENPNLARTIAFLAGCLGAALFDFAAPVIVTAVGAGLLAHTVVASRIADADARAPKLGPLLIMGVLAMIPVVLFYFFYTKPMTHYDIVAYAVNDANAYLMPSEGLSEHNLRRLKIMTRIFSTLSEPPWFIDTIVRIPVLRDAYRAFFGLSTLIGFFLLLRRAPWFGTASLTSLTLVVLLNMLHKMHVTSSQHFLFLIPFIVPALAVGAVWVLSLFTRYLPARVADVPLIAIVLVVAALGMLRGANLDFHRVADHFERINADPAPVWVYYNGQPTITALNPDLPVVLGLLPYESSETAWSQGAREPDLIHYRDSYFASIAEDLAGLEHTYLLFDNYTLLRLQGGIKRVQAIAEDTIGPCGTFKERGTVLLDCKKADISPTPSSDDLPNAFAS